MNNITVFTHPNKNTNVESKKWNVKESAGVEIFHKEKGVAICVSFNKNKTKINCYKTDKDGDDTELSKQLCQTVILDESLN